MNQHTPGRRQALLALGAMPLLWNAPQALAQGAPPQEGTDFRVLPRTIPADPADKIVVLDFFRYGCPHCHDFLGYLEPWQKRQQADVSLQHVPCSFDPSQDAQARAYYALLALGRVEDLHRKVFDAIHVQRRGRLEDPEDIAAFMVANGIARDKWMSVFNSFSMGPSLRRAHDTVVAYAIDGTPSIGVDGRFVTAPSMMQGVHSSGEAQDRGLLVADYLVDRVRGERKRRAR
jgi:thiol:disulfide interchange protein DsbA